jgi:hypothetical protein
MSLLEKILTLVVWALVAVVFYYFRSLALKQQPKQGRDENYRPARPDAEGGWQLLEKKSDGRGVSAMQTTVDDRP